MTHKTDSEQPARHRRASGEAIHVRRGVASRLFISFCVITLMIVLVSLIGNGGLHDSRKTLQASQASFDRVSLLLEDTTSSLDNASAIISNAGKTLDATVTTMKATRDRVNSLNSIDLPAVIAIGTIRESLNAVAVGERTLLMRRALDQEIRNRQRRVIANAFTRANAALESLAGMEAKFNSEKRKAWREFRESWQQWAVIHNRLMKKFNTIDEILHQDPKNSKGFDEILETSFNIAYDIAFGEGQTARDTVTQKLDAVVALISEAARESARIASADTQHATDDAINAMNGMANATGQIEDFKDQMGKVDQQVKATTHATTTSLENADTVRLMFIACSLVGLAVSIVLAVWQTRYLSRPIRHAAEQMQMLAMGKIDTDIMSAYAGRPDEIGALAQSVGDMLGSQREEVGIAGDMASGDFSGSVRLRSEEDQLGKALSEMMRITHDALSRVNRHVQQVTEGAGDISTVSQSLSVGAIETASALVEMSASTTQIGEQTHRNAQNAAQANEFAISSRQVAQRGYGAVEEMVASMHEIQTSSARIAQIVKLIDDIAFQTNLLALNAAVEAARAGRQGKGFSVVAEEVRNLASRSAKAARETATLVEDTVKRVENGAAIAMRTDEAFKEILDNAQRTTELYGQIAESSQEQSRNIDQIVSVLSQIDDSTQQNSRYASQTATAAQTLSRQSGELRQMMVRFQLQESRLDARPAPLPAARRTGKPLPPPIERKTVGNAGRGNAKMIEYSGK